MHNHLAMAHFWSNQNNEFDNLQPTNSESEINISVYGSVAETTIGTSDYDTHLQFDPYDTRLQFDPYGHCIRFWF